MQDQWLLVHSHYLPIHLFHIFNLLREVISEGAQEGVYATPYVDPSEHTVNIGGTEYHPEITETDKV